MGKITDMYPGEFQDFLNTLKGQPVYDHIMKTYFRDVQDSKTPVLDSWEHDCDDVWDAQAYLEEYFEKQ